MSNGSIARIAASLLFTITMLSTAAHAGDGIVHKSEGELIDGSYIVTFVQGQILPGKSTRSFAKNLALAYRAETKRVLPHLGSAVYEMNEYDAAAMAAHPGVARVEQDFRLRISGEQSNPVWGLDRLNDTGSHRDNDYSWDFDGTGVKIFIIDSGVRTTHNEFEGRASWGIDCTGEGMDDLSGHGTHVAGTAAGATYGAAKNAEIVAVKVCNQDGDCEYSDLVCGVNYVINEKVTSPSTPMVANMSLGGAFSQGLNDKAANLVNAGVFVAVAAGNEDDDACDYSPASEPTAYTVGASDLLLMQIDLRADFSNYGSCLDLFAPGDNIKSAWNSSDSATKKLDGTSMAAPHVAGAAALVLEEFPTYTPDQIGKILDARAIYDMFVNLGSDSPNARLHTTSPSMLWTSWMDRDDADGSGDFETYVDFVNEGSLQSSCIPVDIDCRRKSDGKDWAEVGETYSCEPETGGQCVNSQQSDGSCEDYEVRFRCASWTNWMDRDDADGSGDYETIIDFRAAGDLPQTCAEPAVAECRTTSGTDWTQTGETYSCDTLEGGQCVNSEQSDGSCEDYEARFLCPCENGSC